MIADQTHTSNGSGHGSPIEHILTLLADVKKTANGWDARCPAHDDSKPSLGVKVGDDGRVLFHCRSQGCKADAIAARIGLKVSDLFARNGSHTSNGKTKLGPIVATYDYRDEHGTVLYQVTRHYPPKDFRQRRTDGKGGWVWNLHGVPRVPYRLPELLAADRESPVYIAEGERDVATLVKVGLVATTNAQGAGKWKTLDAATVKAALVDRDCVVLADNDQPGRDHATDVCRRLHPFACSIKRIELPDLPDKGDVSDWLSAGGTVEQLQQIVEAAPYWIPDAETPGDECGGEPPDPNANATEPPQPKKQTFGFVWEPVSSGVFFTSDYRPEWIAENGIVARQAGILGGPQKGLKTGIAVDFSISAASGTPWLGTFAIRRQWRVAILSGESGPFALQSLGRRVCDAKGIDPASLDGWLYWQFRLPQLAVEVQLQILREGLLRDRIEIAIIDPLYLSLLSGTDARAENLFDTGPLLMRIAQICEETDTTPLLLHHCTKPAARKLEPLELPDLAFSGIAEFARQWCLISRREAYVQSSGEHFLWCVVGGSVGHNGLYGIDIDEGKLGVDFGGRKWDVRVCNGNDVKKDARSEKEKAKTAAKCEKDDLDDLRLMGVIDAESKVKMNNGVAGYTRVRDLCRFSNPQMTRAVKRMVEAGLAEEVSIVSKSGKGNKATKPARGLRRKPESNGGTDGTKADSPDSPASPNDGTGLSLSLERVPSPVITDTAKPNEETQTASPANQGGDAALFPEPATGPYGGAA